MSKLSLSIKKKDNDNEHRKKNEEKIRKNTANKSLRELFNDKDFKSVQRLTYDLHSKGLFILK